MRKLSASPRCAALLLFLAACFAPGAHAGWLDWKSSPPGEKIQFSSPDDSAAASNSVSNATHNTAPVINPMNSGPLGRFGQELFAPLQNSLKNASSTDVIMDLPPPQQAPRPQMNQRTREQLDRQQNWAFDYLNILYPDTKSKDGSATGDSATDTQGKAPVSIREKYLQNLGQKPDPTRKPWSVDPLTGKTYDQTNQWGATTPLLPNNDSFSKGMFSTGRDDAGPNNSTSGFKNGVLPDLNSAGMPGPRNHRKEFNDTLYSTVPAAYAPNNSTPGLVDLNHNHPTPTTPGALGSSGGGELHRSAINPMLGVIDPNAAALHNRVYDDPTAASLGLPNPVAAKVPVKPRTAQSVQQMLDPFSASVMKPKF